jgi:hypothetical protein
MIEKLVMTSIWVMHTMINISYWHLVGFKNSKFVAHAEILNKFIVSSNQLMALLVKKISNCENTEGE